VKPFLAATLCLTMLAGCVSEPVSDADIDIREGCLREMGVDVDDRSPGSGTIMDREMVAAYRACVAEKGGTPP
jgi:hypothetical protein